MQQRIKILGVVMALVSFLFCFGAGIYILYHLGFQSSSDNVIWTGIALYFIGKSFFVGPMLLLTVLKK